MITIQSGKLFIPENERFVGFAGDDRAAVRMILLPEGYSDHGCVYTLFLRFDDDRVTSAPLTVQAQEDNRLVASWVVRSEQILKHGIIMAQLRVNYEDGTVEHTGCDYFVAAPSAEISEDGSEIDILNRTEFEERMAQAVSEARAIAPYIGEDGYWYVYSTDAQEYVRSFYAMGSIVDSELSDVSINAVQNRVIKAALDEKVDSSRRIAGLPLSANISNGELAESIISKIFPSMVVPGTSTGYYGQYGRTDDGRKPVYYKASNQWVELATADDVPTKTSDLTNDSGFLTAHQDISGKMDLAPSISDPAHVADLPTGQLYRCQGSISIKDTSSEGHTELAKKSDVSGKENTSNKVTSLSSSSTDTQYPSAKCVYDGLTAKANASTTLAGYGITDAYTKTQVDSLIPTVPTKTSDLTNDSGFLTSHQDISGKENTSNKVTALSSSSTDTQYPSAKCVYDGVFGNRSLDFTMILGLINATNLTKYGTDGAGYYHACIPVAPGERYIINCYSANSTYPGAFYTLNGVKVSAIYEDDAVHLNAEITVPAGVDTLWLNNKMSRLPLDQWKVYRILPAADYCEENNSRIISLESERADEQLENLRRLKNLESLFTFRWKPFDKAYYCFVNDGSQKWLHVFYDVFHAHGVPFCAATVGEAIEFTNDTETSPGGRTVKQTLDLMLADGGEVMVYLNAHASDVGTYEGWYNKAVRDGKRMIEAYGYHPRGLILSNDCPWNSALGEQICERFFDYADHVGTKPQYNIWREQFSNTSTVADVKAYIDRTVTTPGFYPIMMHRPTMEPWASAEGMEEILTYIETNYSTTAAVSTYSAVFDAFGTNGFLTLSDLPVYSGGVQ